MIVAGLDRRSSFFAKAISTKMDTRLKPAQDDWLIVSALSHQLVDPCSLSRRKRRRSRLWGRTGIVGGIGIGFHDGGVGRAGLRNVDRRRC
jgi:hypothetical protein